MVVLRVIVSASPDRAHMPPPLFKPRSAHTNTPPASSSGRGGGKGLGAGGGEPEGREGGAPCRVCRVNTAVRAVNKSKVPSAARQLAAGGVSPAPAPTHTRTHTHTSPLTKARLIPASAFVRRAAATGRSPDHLISPVVPPCVSVSMCVPKFADPPRPVLRALIPARSVALPARPPPRTKRLQTPLSSPPRPLSLSPERLVPAVRSLGQRAGRRTAPPPPSSPPP